MFGIGLPEMIVILAVALIVVGPDKLPDLAKSLAKGVLELKRTLNQVKDSLADEDNLIGSVQSDLRKTTEDLKTNLIESDHFTWQDPKKDDNGSTPDEEKIEAADLPPDTASAADHDGAESPAAVDPDADSGDEAPSAGTGLPGGDPAKPEK